jgi:hypothetical protein
MAAGLGFKTFTTGEVLTAADVNGYLMQGILVFASEAARNSAITSPQEGQFAFTKDTNSLWYYTGSAWVASGATGDIEGVTAGTGISGGGTSGTVTITNSMATEITAKADLIVGTGNAAFDNLAVGANGTVLTADSTVSPTGLKWAAPAAPTAVGCILYNTTNYTLANNTETVLTFDSELLDTDGFHSTVTNTGRITIPTGKGGKYFVFAWGQFGNNVTGYRQIQIVVNGQTGTPNRVANTFVASFNAGLTTTGCAILAANDYIEVEAYQNSGGNLNFPGGHSDSQFGAIFLGA